MDHSSPEPLYAQLVDRIQIGVATGEFGPGEQLPSVRNLATGLRVSPATVVQVHNELESGRLIEARKGRGTFVLDLGSRRREQQRTLHARRLVRRLLSDSARLGLSHSDIVHAIKNELSSS